MPFQSLSQLRTCYGKNDTNWNCDEWLKETPSVCSLRNKKGAPQHIVGKITRYVSPIQEGTKGGKYFTVTEKDVNGKIVCIKKIYVPH